MQHTHESFAPTPIRTLALKVNDVSLSHLALDIVSSYFRLAQDLKSYGVATYKDNGILLKKVPHVQQIDTSLSLLAPLRGNCAVAQMRGAGELFPAKKGQEQVALGPYRWQHFAAAIVGGPQDPEEATLSREKKLFDLPDSYKRSINGPSEGEAFFYHFIHQAMRHHVLETSGLDARPLANFLHDFMQKEADDYPRVMAFCTGTELIVSAKAFSTHVVLLRGLEERLECESKMPVSKERFLQYRGVFVGNTQENRDLGECSPLDLTYVKSYANNATILINNDFGIHEVS